MDRWIQRLSQDNTNSWAVYELCKAMEREGVFNNLTPLEQYELVRSTCQACGATGRAIQEGWWEYAISQKSA